MPPLSCGFFLRVRQMPFFLFTLVVRRFCTPLKPPIKFIFNGVIKAFYLSDRREL